MLKPETFYRQLLDHEVRFFTGVPDSLLKEICACISQHAPAHEHVITANEGAAVALGMGYHLATGQLPLIYLQNSGLGNTINPLLSLADPDSYSIPMILLIGWRGEPGVKDEPQHKKQGKTTLSLLEAMGIPYTILDGSLDDAGPVVAEAVRVAKATNAPYALVVRKDTFEKFPVKKGERELPMTREEAIRLLVDGLGDSDIVVATTGMASRELFEVREQLGQGHERDFLTIGGMGHASQIALGIALQKPDRNVVCVDGDGALLMHMGALAINGTIGGANYKHIVLNNGAHDSVGGQPTVARQVDFLSAAKAMGYKEAYSARTPEEVNARLQDLFAGTGPALLEILVDKGNRPDLGRPTTTPIENKVQFMEFVRA